MPYFTHLRKKSYFAVVEANGKLYIDGQGYNPDTLKPVVGAEFDVFSPVPNTTSFFDFGAPVICLPRSSAICKTSQLASVNSGQVKLFDSSLILTGQSIGNVGVGTDLSGNVFVGTKKDPVGSDQKNDKLLSYSSSFDYLSTKSPISIQTGSENKAYRLNTVFWKPTTGSNLLLGINSESLVRGNTTSNNVVTFNPTDTSTYQAVQSDKLELNQLVYLDSTKTNSTSNYAVVNRSQIASSSTRSPQTVMFNTATGARYVPPVEKVDLGLSNYWISIYGNLGTTGASSAAKTFDVGSDGSVYAASSEGIYKLDVNGNLVWHQNLLYSGFSTGIAGNDGGLAVDNVNGQVIVVGQAGGTTQTSMATVGMSTSGTIFWQKRYGSSNWDTARGLDACVDLSGNSYVVGYVASSGGTPRRMVEKRDSSGTIIWNTSRYSANAVAVDSSQNAYVVGTFEYNPTSNYYKTVIYKINSSNQLVFDCFAQIGTAINTWHKVAIDSSNNIYVSGVLDGSSTRIIAKYDTSGNLIWTRRSNGTPSSTQTSVAVDGNGHVYFLFNYTVNDLRIIKLDSSGNVIWCNSVSLDVQASAAEVRTDYLNNVYVQFSAVFVTGDRTTSCIMKLPPDGSGTGTYTFSRGNLVYQSSSPPSWSSATLTTSISAQTATVSPTSESTAQFYTTTPSLPATRQSLGTTYDPVPDAYVGCFASNAVWTTFNEGSGPIYFTGNCPFAGSLGIDFVRVRYITESVPTCKRVWATISNPSSLSLTIPYDMNYRNIRPFLFKNDSNQLMLGVFAYYNGSTTANNVAVLMVFSVGSTTQTDSITLTYLQRIDLSGGGIITSVTPVDDTQRSWLINYGDTARVYTFSQASNFTLTNTYTWGRSGEIDSYGIDSRGRLWYTTGDILNYIPLKTDPATVNTALKAYFDSASYSYSGTAVDSNLYVSAYATDGAREQKTVTVTLQGSSVTFADGTTTKTVTTSASSDLAIPVKIIGSGIFQAKLS